MNRKAITLLSLGHLACDSVSGAIPALLTYCAAHLGYTYEMAAGLTFAGCILSTAAQPAFGILADRSEKTWLIPAGVLLAGAALGMTGLFSDYIAVFLLIMLSGLGGAMFHPEAARLVNHISGKRKGTALALFSVGGNAGFAAGPLIMAGSLAVFGLHGTLVTAVIACLTAAALLFSLQKIAPQSYQKTAAAQKDLPRGRNDWRSFSRLTFCILSRSLSFMFAGTFIPLYFLRTFALDPITASWIPTLIFTVGAIATMTGGLLSDRLGYVRVLRLASLILLPSMALLPFLDHMAFAAAVLIPIGFSVFAPFSSIVVLGQQYLRRSVGFASGVTFGISFSFGGILAPFMGRLADLHGMAPLFIIMAVVNGLSLLFSYTLKEAETPQE